MGQQVSISKEQQIIFSMESMKSSSNISPENGSRLQTRALTLSQSNSKLIYDGGDASLYIQVDSNLNKLALNTLHTALSSSIKGDLKFIEFNDVKELNKIDYKRQLMSVVVLSEQASIVKYMNTFMRNEEHQQSFHVIFKCDTKEAKKNLERIENQRLKLVTCNWDQVESTIEDIYTTYYKKLVEFKGETKVNNKYYDVKTRDIVLNVYYPSKFPDVTPYIAQLEKRGSRSFKSIHFVKYDVSSEIIKRDILRTKTKKTMTKMLTQSHSQLQSSKPQQTAMKQIAQISQNDKNLILTTSEHVEQIQELIRHKPNYEIVVLNSEKEREIFFRGFLKCYKDPSEQDPVITCHRLILIISEEEDSLIEYAHELTEIDQTIGVAVYSGKASLIAELFLVGEDANNYGLLVCSQYDSADYENLILAKQIKNVMMVILSENGTEKNKTLVSATVSCEDQLCEYLQSVIEQRQQYYDPVRGIEGNRIHVYFQEKEQQLKSYVEEGILARKRLQAHSYATLQDLEAYILQTISIDGILVVCSPKSMNSVLKVTNNQKNVKLLIYGDSREAAYNSQVINYCENKQSLLNFLLNIPNNEDYIQSLSDLLYNDVKIKEQPFLKQDDPIEFFIAPFSNKPLVYIRLPNKLQQSDCLIFEQRIKKQLGVDVYMGIYERIEDIRNLTFREQPLSFLVVTTRDMKWIEKFVQNEKNCNFEILLYTDELIKGKKLLKHSSIKLVTSNFEDVEHYILGRIDRYQNMLYGPMVEYEYGTFLVNQNDTVILYYPSGNQKLKLELEGKREKSQFLTMAMMIPYDNFQELQRSISTYPKNTKILIYVNEIPESGWQTKIQGILRQYSNSNFAIVTNRQGRSVASYCKYSSNRLKKCTTWIGNIEVAKPPKVAFNRNSKLGRISQQVMKPQIKPLEIAIDKMDAQFAEARDISLWNTKQPNVRYNTYIGNQQLLSLENKAIIDSNKKYLLLMSEDNVMNHLNTFKNSCIKLIVQGGSKRVNHENILFQSTPEKVNSFLVNPFRDKIQYPRQFYYNTIRIAAPSDLVSQEDKVQLSSNGLMIETYNTPEELSTLRRQPLDLIISRNMDNVDPHQNRVVLIDAKGMPFEERIPYQFVGNMGDVRKYMSILSYLKKLDLKSFHERVADRRAIAINQFPNKRIFERNYTLVENSQNSDMYYGQQDMDHILESGNKQYVAPHLDYIQQILKSIPNYNKQRLNALQINNKPCLFFDDKTVMREIQGYYSHLNTLKYQNYDKSQDLEKLLNYSQGSSGFVFSHSDPVLQLIDQTNSNNFEGVLMNKNISNQNMITAPESNTIKRMINSLRLNKSLPSKMRAETILMIPANMNSGELYFCASNLEQSTKGVFQIQEYQTPESIPDISCNTLYVVTPEEMVSRVSSKLLTLSLSSSKNMIVKVSNQTRQHKDLYRSKDVDLVTDNQSDICEFILTNPADRKYHIPATSYLLLPSYYSNRLTDNQKSQKNIRLYEDEQDASRILSWIPEQKYIVINRFNSMGPFSENTKVFYEGSGRVAPMESISQLCPSRIMNMIVVEEPVKKISNAVSGIQFSYTLNKRDSSKSLKQQKVAAQPIVREQTNHQYVLHNHYYINERYQTNIHSRERYPKYQPLRETQMESQYYSYRTVPHQVREVVLQPINFPQKFTKNPSATLVPYKNQEDLKELISRFSTDPGIKVTVQRYTRFEQYQIPAVPPSVRPALMEYFQNQLNFGNQYNVPDFNNEYYPTTTNRYNTVSSSSSIKKQLKENSPPSSIKLFSQINDQKARSQMINQETKPGQYHVYYKYPHHKFIPTHFNEEDIQFIPYYIAQDLVSDLERQGENQNTIVIEEDSDIITIQQKLGNALSLEFIRILRSDFNDFASLPNTQGILLETSKQESIIEFLKGFAFNPVIQTIQRKNSGPQSFAKKNSDMFSQLSTNIY